MGRCCLINLARLHIVMIMPSALMKSLMCLLVNTHVQYLGTESLFALYFTMLVFVLV